MGELLRVNEFVLPGNVMGRISPKSDHLRLGLGLTQSKENIIATKAGILRFQPPNFYWIENNQIRYVPSVDDTIIGIITEKHPDNYKVDIGSASPATLGTLAFDGASKKNKPNLNVGSLVYSRVIVANKDMDPELVCLSLPPVHPPDMFGPLNSGYMFKCSTGLAKSLMSTQCPVLAYLGKRIPFEICVGINGRVWVNSGSVSNTILITNAILNSEFLSPKQTSLLVQQLFDIPAFQDKGK